MFLYSELCCFAISFVTKFMQAVLKNCKYNIITKKKHIKKYVHSHVYIDIEVVLFSIVLPIIKMSVF